MRIPNKIHSSRKVHWTLGFTGLKTSILATVFTFFQVHCSISPYILLVIFTLSSINELSEAVVDNIFKGMEWDTFATNVIKVFSSIIVGS